MSAPAAENNTSYYGEHVSGREIPRAEYRASYSPKRGMGGGGGGVANDRYRSRSRSPAPYRRSPERGGYDYAAPRYNEYRDERDGLRDREMMYRGDRERDRGDRGDRYDRGDRGDRGDRYDRGDRDRGSRRRDASFEKKKRPVERGTEEDRRNTRQLFIGNLPYSYSERDVVDMCEKFGPVVGCTLPMDRFTGKNKGFCFLEFSDRRDAEDFYSDMSRNGTINGRKLKVDWDVGKEKKGIEPKPEMRSDRQMPSEYSSRGGPAPGYDR